MCLEKWPSWCLLLTVTIISINGADDEYNVLHRDGSFEFGYNEPNSYHHAAGNRNNVVRGEFGGRNPGTGKIDSVQYTAGPRGYRPRGKNIHRKYDLNQSGPRPIGSKDDPYYDPYEDPSYNFQFKTRTYNRQESANRAGDVSGKYNYIDDVGELHNVEFIAGKNTGFHVKTPFPDSNPRAYYGRLYYRGRGKPIPRGRTSIQRGLDGSYRFVSAGPDQRRTETSDATGHVRGSYTYLDDKGVQHSVHYIAGPETGYRVLKNVKGPHLPTVYPFGRPEIVPPDFYDYIKDDVFDTAASGHVKPINNVGRPGGSSKPSDAGSDFGGDLGKPGQDSTSENLLPTGNKEDDNSFNEPSGGDLNLPSLGGNKPSSGGSSTGPQSDASGSKPSASGIDSKPPFGESFNRPTASRPGSDTFGDDSESDGDDFEGELFGPSGGSTTRPKPPRPSQPLKPQKPIGSGGGSGASRPTTTGSTDDGSYKPSSSDTGDDGSYIPPGDINQDDGSYKPGPNEAGLETGGEKPRPGGFGGSQFGKPSRPTGSKLSDSNYSDDYDEANGLFGSESNARPPSGGRPPVIQIQGSAGSPGCAQCSGTIVTNVGDKLFSVPPGVSVRAHVQSIDLLPFVSKVPSPTEQFNEEMNVKTEQLNSAASNIVNSTVSVTESSQITTTEESVTETTTVPELESTTIDDLFN